MSLRRANSVEEYVEWVRRLPGAGSVGMPRVRAARPFSLPRLSRGPGGEVKDLFRSMARGTYSFDREDLPFIMDLAGKYFDQIPFHTLLEQINETRRRGLAVEGDAD